MHDSMQQGPIQGQGHKPFKVGNPTIFSSCLLHHLRWELATDHGFCHMIFNCDTRNYISGTAEAIVTKFCMQVEYINF